MTLLAPLFLAAAAAVAAGVVALHLLARQRPRDAAFPTARFVPDRPARAPSRALRPADLRLLALRVLTVLLAGAALAQPVRTPPRKAIRRVVALDLSRALADPADAVARAAALLRDGDALVTFDSVARAVHGNVRDSLRTLRVTTAPGSLSAALIVASRAAAALAPRADSLELTVVSPLVREEWDDATAAIRARWRGRINIARVAAARAPREEPGVELRADPDDPLRATVALLGLARNGALVRIVRDSPTAADSAWAHDSGGALVWWPAATAALRARERADTVGALIAGSAVSVAAWVRTADPAPGRAMARWVDGAPAATERRSGAGCLRSVAIPLAAEGDLALREGTGRVVARLAAPCGVTSDFAPLSDSLIATLAGAGPALIARSVRAAPRPVSRAAPWLLGGVLLLAMAEPLARRARRDR